MCYNAGGIRLLVNFLDFSLLVGENCKIASEEIFVANLPNGVCLQVVGKVTWSNEERKIWK